MSEPTASPGARMYEEFLAVHTILRRGAELVAGGFGRLAEGVDEVSVDALVESTRWLIEFTHHHHACEDELFWPELISLYPEAAEGFEALAAEHEELDQALGRLARVTESLAAEDRSRPPNGRTARDGAVAARQVRDVLAAHLRNEEPAVRDLFPGVPGPEIDRLRRAIIEGGPRFGAHLVFGLLAEPEPAPGADLLVEHFPAPVRAARPQLLLQFGATLRAMACATPSVP
ncbi:hemerythrin domain-containing protein [Streptomyces sp. NPDC006879]|uniref:hemerythrin domain-containing protein n=1 Tax=Streptomyces sp. NPDC006879 TaxID=3364767 RepID=UPI00369E2302